MLPSRKVNALSGLCDRGGGAFSDLSLNKYVSCMEQGSRVPKHAEKPLGQAAVTEVQ